MIRSESLLYRTAARLYVKHFSQLEVSQMGGGVVVIFVLVIAAAIIIRLVSGGMDHDRVRKYVQSRGGRVIGANWSPMGPGWFGEKSDRIYQVRYVDPEGNEHESHCKTSLLSGVYFTEDRIVRRAQPQADTQSLEEENQRLREELERLRANQG